MFTHLAIFYKEHVIRHSATEVEYINVVFDCHLKVGQRIHSLYSAS